MTTAAQASAAGAREAIADIEATTSAMNNIDDVNMFTKLAKKAFEAAQSAV